MSTVPSEISKYMGSATKLVAIWGTILFNVKAYGAKGDGVTDDTAAIQAAINAAIAVKGEVFFPPGNYKVTATLTLNGAVKLSGVDATTGGSVITMTTNNPLFMITAGCTIEDLALSGSLNAAFTLQDGIYINNCNNVYVRNVFLAGFYNCIHLKDSVFYSFFDNVYFGSAINSGVYGEGTSAPGYAVAFNNCQVAFSNNPNYAFFFDNAGSVQFDSVMISPALCKLGGVVFNSNAPLAGIHQISNSVIEASLAGVHGLKIVGSANFPVKFIFVSNTYIAGDASVYFGNATDIFFDNCYFTGTNDGLNSRNAVYIDKAADNLFFTNCEYQVSSVPITANTTCTGIELDITNPSYQGGFQFVYLPFLAASVVQRLNVSGGIIGSNAKPIDISYPNSNFTTHGVYGGKFKYRSTVVLSGDGTTRTFIISHGLAAKPTVWYGQEIEGNSGTARIQYISVNDTSIAVTFATAPILGTNNVQIVLYAEV